MYSNYKTKRWQSRTRRERNTPRSTMGVPYALDRNGARRLAISTEKCDEPFQCPECRNECYISKGQSQAHHFSHKPSIASSVGCTSGGEGAIHMACKLFIQEHIDNIIFVKSCAECNREVARWAGTEAALEVPVLERKYIVDLLVTNMSNSTEAVVEVLHTHRCSGDKLEALACVYSDNVFEIRTFDHKEICEFPLTLSCENRPQCGECKRKEERRVEEQRRVEEERRVEEQRRLQEERRLEEERRVEEQRRLQEERLEKERRIEKKRRFEEEHCRFQEKRRLVEEQRRLQEHPIELKRRRIEEAKRQIEQDRLKAINGAEWRPGDKAIIYGSRNEIRNGQTVTIKEKSMIQGHVIVALEDACLASVSCAKLFVLAST